MFPFYQASTRPLVIAHRGGAGLWPENTLFALQEAVKLGVDLSEIDLRMSRDGVLVVMHDRSVDRTTNANGLVQDLTLAELKKLDAGYHWTSDGGRTFPFRGRGIRVPSLSEVFMSFPEQVISLEIKQRHPPIVGALRTLVEHHRKMNQILVSAFDSHTMKLFRRLCPDIASAATHAEIYSFVRLSRMHLTRFFLLKATALEVPFELVTPIFLKVAHKKQRRVDVWTVNDIPDMERLLAWGVDGILTDYPDRLLHILQTKA